MKRMFNSNGWGESRVYIIPYPFFKTFPPTATAPRHRRRATSGAPGGSPRNARRHGQPARPAADPWGPRRIKPHGRRMQKENACDYCVCVCPTLDKGSSTTTLSTLHGQGGQACHIQPGPTKLGCGRGSTKGRFGVYLQQLLKKLSNPPCLIHGGYMFPPINLFPAAELVVASPVQIVFETTCKQCSTIHLRRLFHIAVLRHPSHRRN